MNIGPIQATMIATASISVPAISEGGRRRSRPPVVTRERNGTHCADTMAARLGSSSDDDVGEEVHDHDEDRKDQVTATTVG